MRALRYLVAVDESFNESDFSRTKRFLRAVIDIAPAANIGCVRRQTSLIPFVPGMLMSSVGLTVVSTYCHLGFSEDPENSGHCDAIWSESSGVMLSFEDLWDRFRRLLKDSSLQSRSHGHGISDVIPLYDAIVCVRPVHDAAMAQPGEDLLICQIARWAKLPIWLCPLNCVAIDRVVIAVAGRPDDDRLLVTGQMLARALNVSFAIACCGCDSFNQRLESIAPWAQWSIISCSCMDDLLLSLNPGDLLVMDASGRSPISRLFATSHIEKLVDGLQNPALILPHSQSWWPFGANGPPQCSTNTCNSAFGKSDAVGNR
jgi:hypothetical protein